MYDPGVREILTRLNSVAISQVTAVFNHITTKNLGIAKEIINKIIDNWFKNIINEKNLTCTNIKRALTNDKKKTAQ